MSIMKVSNQKDNINLGQQVPNSIEKIKPFTEFGDKCLEEKFFSTMEHPMCILSVKEAKIIIANSAMETLLGFSKTELQSKSSFSLTKEEMLSNARTFSTFINFQLPDQSFRSIFCNCTVDSDQDNIFLVVSNEVNELRESFPEFKILVVDDNSLQQKIMTVLLRKLGFTPDVAVNGQEAVEAIEKQSYDIIFMDICMPVMNGLQATKEIKRKRSLDSPFIIAATSNTEPDDKLKCAEAGMDSFIPKPIKIDQIRAVLRHAKKLKTTNTK